MAAGVPQLVESRNVPEDVSPSANALEELLQPLLELADVHLASDELAVPGFEDHPSSLYEAPFEGAEDRRLPDALLAYKQHRARRLATERALELLDGCA